MSWATQAGASVRLEWGAAAIDHPGSDVDCVIVVDVMSFSTCVDADASDVAARLVRDCFVAA